MKQQRIERNSQNKTPEIIDNRSPTTKATKVPLRTIHYMEVGDMDQQKVAMLVKQVGELYQGDDSETHYIIPIRHGKIGTDMAFETEWLEVVHKTCEIKDGKIVLKDGAKDVIVVRQQV